MSNSYLAKASFMSWLAATIGWQKNALCAGANSKNSGLGLRTPADGAGSRYTSSQAWGSQEPISIRLALVKIEVSQHGELSFYLRRDKLREIRQREGRYLLRSNLGSENPAQLWQLYVLLTQIEEAFKNLKGDLAVRPIFHQLQKRIEAHILIAFLAFCLHATLRHKLRLRAPGLTPRSVLEQLSAVQMLDVHFPTTDGRAHLRFVKISSSKGRRKFCFGSQRGEPGGCAGQA